MSQLVQIGPPVNFDWQLHA